MGEQVISAQAVRSAPQRIGRHHTQGHRGSAILRRGVRAVPRRACLTPRSACVIGRTARGPRLLLKERDGQQFSVDGPLARQRPAVDAFDEVRELKRHTVRASLRGHIRQSLARSDSKRRPTQVVLAAHAAGGSGSPRRTRQNRASGRARGRPDGWRRRVRRVDRRLLGRDLAARADQYLPPAAASAAAMTLWGAAAVTLARADRRFPRC
jgi:hypothetical protein